MEFIISKEKVVRYLEYQGRYHADKEVIIGYINVNCCFTYKYLIMSCYPDGDSSLLMESRKARHFLHDSGTSPHDLLLASRV